MEMAINCVPTLCKTESLPRAVVYIASDTSNIYFFPHSKTPNVDNYRRVIPNPLIPPIRPELAMLPAGCSFGPLQWITHRGDWYWHRGEARRSMTAAGPVQGWEWRYALESVSYV